METAHETISRTDDNFWKDVLQEVPRLDKSETSISPEGKILFAEPYGNQQSRRLSLYCSHPKFAMYLERVFLEKDIYEMKICAATWVITMIEHYNYAKSTREPWWFYGYALRNFFIARHFDVEILKASKIRKLNFENLDTVFKCFLKFCTEFYKCDRYRYRQEKLWQDLQKDFSESDMRLLFGDCQDRYVNLLLRVVASHAGHELGNVEGD